MSLCPIAILGFPLPWSLRVSPYLRTVPFTSSGLLGSIFLVLLSGCASLSELGIAEWETSACERVEQLQDTVDTAKVLFPVMIAIKEAQGATPDELSEWQADFNRALDIVELHLKHWRKMCNE